MNVREQNQDMRQKHVVQNQLKRNLDQKELGPIKGYMHEQPPPRFPPNYTYTYIMCTVPTRS